MNIICNVVVVIKQLTYTQSNDNLSTHYWRYENQQPLDVI